MSTTTWTHRFVWHDLMSTDAAKSAAFYAALMGWRIEGVPMGGFTYHMLFTEAGPIGGIVEEKAIPMSHWMPYCCVDSVDASAARVEELGGSLCVPPTDIPNTGRFAVVGDPQGAYFTLYKGLPESAGADPDLAAHGRVCWNELMTTDLDGAQRFYSALLGWRPEAMDMGPMGKYHVQMAGAKHAGGIMKNPMPGAPAWWCMYFMVNDIVKSTEQARALGAEVLVNNEEIPNMGRFSLLKDPVGAMVALFQNRD